jgi:hypothetical protein
MKFYLIKKPEAYGKMNSLFNRAAYRRGKCDQYPYGPTPNGFALAKAYMFLRERGVPARIAYETVLRRDWLATRVAADLVDRFGRWTAEALVRGAIEMAPRVGIRRALCAAGMDEWYESLARYPRTECGQTSGYRVSASATLRWLRREVLPAIRYV